MGRYTFFGNYFYDDDLLCKIRILLGVLISNLIVDAFLFIKKGTWPKM